jgi:hypothetical protein
MDSRNDKPMEEWQEEDWERENKSFYAEPMYNFLKMGSAYDSTVIQHIVNKANYSAQEIAKIFKEAGVNNAEINKKIDDLLCRYEKYISDFSIDRFETMVGLHIRSYLHEFQYLLSSEQKSELERCDKILKKNAG